MLDLYTKSNMHEFNVFNNGSRALYLSHTNEHMSKAISQAVGFDGSRLARYQGSREVYLNPTMVMR